MDAMNYGKIDAIVKTLLNYYENNNTSKALELLEDLPSHILDQMRTTKQTSFGLPFYSSFIEILRQEIEHFEGITCERLNLVGSVLLSIRNTFYESMVNQNAFSSDLDTLKTIFEIVMLLFSDEVYSKLRDCSAIAVDDSEIEWCSAHSFCASCCVTCISNLMAGNPTNANEITPLLLPHITTLLRYPDPDVGQKSASILHHFLINKEFTSNISSYRDHLCLSPVLSLYETDGQYACFVLFCLELLLCIEGVFGEEWSGLKEVEALMALDVLSSIESDANHARHKGGVPVAVVEFCKEQYKVEADKVLCNKKLESLQPRILPRLTSFMCNCASNHSRSLLQTDKSCLISTVYLLKALTTAGDSGSNCYSRLSDLSNVEEIDKEAETNPAFGFKTDLIKLIAALVYRNRVNQDVVRDSDGIGLLLTNSQYDGKNPLIREASVLAIRHLLEGNLENQKMVEQIQYVGQDQSPLLEQMGAKVTLENGKAKLISDSC